jgi:hypothetical protein
VGGVIQGKLEMAGKAGALARLTAGAHQAESDPQFRPGRIFPKIVKI